MIANEKKDGRIHKGEDYWVYEEFAELARNRGFIDYEGKGVEWGNRFLDICSGNEMKELTFWLMLEDSECMNNIRGMNGTRNIMDIEFLLKKLENGNWEF